jgi:hypothetical protein
MAKPPRGHHPRTRDRRLDTEDFRHMRLVVSTYHLLDALFHTDPILSRVPELLELAATSAIGMPGENRRRECFVCRRPWSAHREPAGVLLAEIVGGKCARRPLPSSAPIAGGALTLARE